MELLTQKIQEYAEAHTQAESPVLAELNRETHLSVLYPVMLSGHLQGQLLQFFSNMIQPKTILEIGTYTGYSAICLAAGLQENGQLYTIECNPELEDFASNYFKKAGLEKKITQHIGDALDIIPTLNFEFDIVFIDADKENYINYYNLVFDKVRKGGYIILDNVLWHGKVFDENDVSEATLAIRKINELIQKDDRVENLLLPVRDGLMICRKK